MFQWRKLGDIDHTSRLQKELADNHEFQKVVRSAPESSAQVNCGKTFVGIVKSHFYPLEKSACFILEKLEDIQIKIVHNEQTLVKGELGKKHQLVQVQLGQKSFVQLPGLNQPTTRATVLTQKAKSRFLATDAEEYLAEAHGGSKSESTFW